MSHIIINHNKLPRGNVMTSCLGDPRSILDTFETPRKRYNTMGHQQSFLSSQDVSQDVDEIAAVPRHLWPIWKALIGRYGIYDENHGGVNRQRFIWRRFSKSGSTGSGSLLLEETRFLKFDQWRKGQRRCRKIKKFLKIKNAFFS